MTRSGIKSGQPGKEKVSFGPADHIIDARGLLCPEPLLLCRKALDSLTAGGRVHVKATDPHAEIDFEVFAKRTRHLVLRSGWEGDTFHVLVQKA